MFDTNPKVLMSKVRIVEYERGSGQDGYINLFHISSILPISQSSYYSRISLYGGKEILVEGHPTVLLKRFMREANGGHEIDSSAEGDVESD